MKWYPIQKFTLYDDSTASTFILEVTRTILDDDIDNDSDNSDDSDDISKNLETTHQHHHFPFERV